VTSVFVDAGYLIALEAADDQHHAAAVRHWRGFLPTHPRLVTTSFVLDEVVTFFNSRGRHSKAVEVGSRLLASPSVRLVHVDEELFRSAFAYLERRPDKRFSLTDCVSFVLMSQLGIQEALAFDAHFEQAGFTRLPPTRV
jgi:predicted nucleic acid-binding protein